MRFEVGYDYNWTLPWRMVRVPSQDHRDPTNPKPETGLVP